MKHLYFVRHGLSHMNVAGIHSGHIDTALTDDGINQAHQAADDAVSQGLHFDLIISSPLSRARETAKIIANKVGYDANRIEYDERVMERNFGDLEGRNIKEHFGIDLEHYHADETLIDHINGMEKLDQLNVRAGKFYEYLQSLPQETVLVASHGAFGRALIRCVKNLPYNAKLKPLNNAEIIKII